MSGQVEHYRHQTQQKLWHFTSFGNQVEESLSKRTSSMQTWSQEDGGGFHEAAEKNPTQKVCNNKIK